ncbi:serine/threonine protein kinase [Streptomyces sp. NBC_00237]|uniref:serine/threonine-protein kinase n=1 Tax=Streptomyces sp. NBC_00237 TaxID=2975687 RepID=UPI00225540A7|nr:serine/threonine-protein kinase [Streptomyces sp. NBC_00237]MCX5204754.1 serine/threonine protein kinase [Streptomyces sp. NBC_00237]
MTNDGGQAYEPTSYELRPPNAPQPPPQQGVTNHQGAPYPGGTPYRPGSPYQENPSQQYAQAQGPHPSPTPRQPPAHTPPQVPVQGTRATGLTDPEAGRTIGGRYRLVSRLGHGGMGTVWRAHDEVVDRDVAVKEPRVPDHLPERQRHNVYLRMQREARAAARIEHPSVVTMHDVVVEDGKPWIVMELIQGHSLGDRLQEGTLDVREAARIGLAVLGALTAAHQAGVLHRDVKPDNVMLGQGDRVVLSDFGIAQIEGEQGLTDTGGFVGSPEFIAPERVLGQRPGPASDLWSLGVVLYAAVEGMSPYRRSNTPATLQAVLSADPQTPARGSGAFGALVMRLLHKDPAARPHPDEVRQALEKATGQAPPPPSAPTRVMRPGSASDWVPPVLQRSKKARFGLLGGVLVLALALVVVLVNPFAGDGPPEGWKLHRELQSVTAEVYLPGDYKKAEDNDAGIENYYEPGNVFQVKFERVALEDIDDDDVKPTKSGWSQYYRKGGKSGLDVKKAEVKTTDTTWQGKKSFDTVVDFTPYSTSDTEKDPIRYRYHERLLLSEEKKAYWRLHVAMPSEGRFAAEGEQLFNDITTYLKILDL